MTADIILDAAFCQRVGRPWRTARVELFVSQRSAEPAVLHTGREAAVNDKMTKRLAS